MRRLYLVVLSLEWAVIFASVKMAGLLLTHPKFFDDYPVTFSLVLHSWLREEWIWGLLAVLAAGLKCVGLIMVIRRRHWAPGQLEWAYYLRQSGWFLSSILWGGLSFSMMLGSFWSLASSAGMALSMISFGIMAIGPVMPEVKNGTAPNQW